jgi:hypothetical protein
MNWKKVVLVMAAAMAAAYFGARLAAPESGNLALAGGASVGDPRGGLVVVTTGAQTSDSNRLVMVDTNKKRLMIYRLHSNYMRLIAARPYKFDLKIISTDGMKIPGDGLTYAATKLEIMRSPLLKKDEKESMPRGKEMVLTTDGTRDSGNRIILINPTEKRILVYALNRNFLGLLAVRHYEYDNYADFHTTGYAPGDGYTYQRIKTMVETELKRSQKQ